MILRNLQSHLPEGLIGKGSNEKRGRTQGLTWEGVDVHPYKEEGTHFKGITRQTLLRGTSDLPVEFRYFEILADGHSTLEMHQHQHVVTITHGSGQVLVGDTVETVSLHDLVHIPPCTWHQFRATNGERLGFLCVVSNDRDRPHRPDEDEIEVLRKTPEVAQFIRI